MTPTGSYEELDTVTDRAGRIFHEVADISKEARQRYFAENGVGASTRCEVEELLAYDSDGGLTLDSNIAWVAQKALARFEQKDLRCGPYRLGEPLGRGGMGTVHLAERVDGEVAQSVAVKLLRPGADEPLFRQRFLAERQILATLSHPNIARLLDAGHRDDGQPYLVMEYVEGKSIDAYCAGLGIRQKIELFLKVCAAVGYLHRNLVVHRDLKPSNILVTSEGEPKLLDFGIAKMLDLSSDSTMTGMRMLTPDYASPEQVAGCAVTTATDVYSLGAVLYELLTGAPPRRFDGQSAEAIAASIAAGKIAPPGKLMPELKGDLEMILMKALRREPEERYATIEQFSEDLENYLQSRPIRARKRDVWYRTRKFVRRYWLPVAAAALAVSGLTVGLLIANQQRAIAQRRFIQVRQLANKLFEVDAEVRRTPGTTKVRQMIVRTSLEYLQRLQGDVGGDPELALEVGNAYMRVARVQGVPISSNLGQMDQAEQNLKIARGFVDSVLATQPRNRTAMLRAAQIAHDRMLLARFNGNRDEALALAGKSAFWLEKFHAGKEDKAETSSILNTYLNVADQHVIARRFDDALRLCSHAKELAKALDSPRWQGTFLFVTANVFRYQGDLDEALKQIQESVRILEPGTSSEQTSAMNLILALVYDGRILGENGAISMGRPDQAVAPLHRAFTISDEYVHKDPNDQNSRGRLAMAGLALADMLRNTDAPRALEVYNHALRHMAEVKDNTSFRRYEASALSGSSYALVRLGRPAEARQRLDDALERLRQLKLYPVERIRPGSETDRVMSALADYEAAQGEVKRAIGIYEDLLQKVMAAEPKTETNLSDAVDVSRLYTAIALLRRRAHETELASGIEARRLDLWRHWDARLPNNDFVHRQLNSPYGSWELSLGKRKSRLEPSHWRSGAAMAVRARAPRQRFVID